MTSPTGRSRTAGAEERLRWTITSLSGVGFELAAAATMIEGDGRDRVERVVAELDQVTAALRYRFYQGFECGGDAGESVRIDSSP